MVLVRPFCVVVAATVFATLSTGSPPAANAPQQPPTAGTPDQQKPPTFRTEANFVRVDVFATRAGRPVKDLKVDDFELLEDGVRQTVSTFEHVDVRTGVPQEQRTEPNSIRESGDAMKNPRARVFVLFLDVPHVTMAGSWTIREPLIRMVERLMGPDDLVGIMTPRMAAADVVFARRTRVIEEGLRNRWPWGERHTLEKDEREKMYEMCYGWAETQDVVNEMIARKRERATLEALHELVTWLRDQREERKAVLTLTEGWLLYRRNPDLARPRVINPRTGETEPIPGPDPIGVGPDGRLGRFGRGNNTGVTKSECDAERLALSEIDNEYFLRDLIAEANRSNASFYTVDPRGLATADAPMGPAPPPPPDVDMALLKKRLDTLHVLAHNTDGFAVVNSNDLDKGLRRISDDLTSYYLVGYYSTNTKLDGRYRTLKVTVKQPGVQVRARRGYKAATAAEVTAARGAAAAPVPEALASARAAITDLRIRTGAELSAHAIAVKGTETTVWVAGELARPLQSAASGIVTVRTVGATNSVEVQIAPRQRGFVVGVPLRIAAMSPVEIQVRITPGEGQPPLTDAVSIDAAGGLPRPLMFRRGPATGNRQEPAGQPVFSRTERARFEVPLLGDATLESARVLDRNGTATEIPVSVADRTDSTGQRWGAAEVVLAAFAAGDYLIELSGSAAGTPHTVLAAFRVTR